jgi:hypothetical protein
MTSSTASDGQHHDLGAIEAAVRETARGRAFLANYAKRVQQSDTLTMLAMLGRLERVADELASRLTELEAETAYHARPSVSSAGGGLPCQPMPGPTNAGTAETMQRIDELAVLLGDLNRNAVQLAAQCVGGDGRSGSEMGIEIDARAYLPPNPTLLASASSTSDHLADEKVLDEIAQALAT